MQWRLKYRALRGRVLMGAALLATTAAGGGSTLAHASEVGNESANPSAVAEGASIAANEGVLVVDGRGNGHGIGLSQYGALGYAIDDGWTAEQILAHYYGGTTAATVDASQWITVRLNALDEQQTAVIHSRGQATTAADPLARQWGSIVVREVPGTVGNYRVWGRLDQVCPAAAINLDDPLNGWTLIAEDVTPRVEIDAPAGSETGSDLDAMLAVCETNGGVRTYRGSIYAMNGTVGENRTVNEAPLEQYLRSVVAAEVSASWANLGGGRGIEALRAQAVAARSYALTQNRYSFAKTCDTQACQVYNGAARRPGIGLAVTRYEFPEIDMAVGATPGLVRKTASGAVANTMFSSSSGGWTAPSTSPGFPAVQDLGDDTASNPHHRWTVNVSAVAVQTAWPQIGTFERIAVTGRNGLGEWGGRVTTATIIGSSADVKVSGDDIRRALGLRSNWFSVRSLCPTEQPVDSGAAPTLGGLGYVAVSPTRVVDTRNAIGVPRVAVPGGCTLVAEMPNRPSGAAAAVVTITTTKSRENGFVTAYPCGTKRPNTSAIQVLAGVDVPGTTIVPLSADGRICLYTHATSDVIVDLLGWLAPSGATLRSAVPNRILDSRSAGAQPRPAGTVTRVVLPDGVAPGAASVAVNLTATQAGGGGYVTAYPCDATRPETSVLNVRRSVDVANRSFMPLGADRSFCLWNSVTTHLIVDIDGWFVSTGGASMGVQPGSRAVDTRSNIGLNGLFQPGVVRTIDLGDRSSGLFIQVTAVDATASGYVTVYPCATNVPDTSVLNSSPGRNVANLVLMPTDAEGRLCLVTSMPTHLLVDVVGRAA